MPFRFQKLDISKIEELIPMLNFFDSIPDSDFIKTVDLLTQGYGRGFHGITVCLFPDELDEYMISHGEGFDNGVQFIDMDDEIVVDIGTFWKYLTLACEIYWQQHPKDKFVLQDYLARPKPSLEMSPEVAGWWRKWKSGEYDYLKALKKIKS
ncbi:MAG: ribonuclease toxin immunity protein CdiI [Pyrinomonadaceae bacterium]